MKGKAAATGMPSVEELKKASRELHIPKYNYCGPKTQFELRQSSQYGKMMKQANKKTVGTAPFGKPYNKLDRACMAHDRVYSNPKASAAAVRASDDKLAKSAMQIAKARGTNASQRVAGFAVAKAFGLKKKAEETGIVRRGAFAAGGEKRGLVGRLKDRLKGKAKDMMANVTRGPVQDVVKPKADKPTAVKATPAKPDAEVFRILPVRRKRDRK